jgi:hypothetical protein
LVANGVERGTSVSRTELPRTCPRQLGEEFDNDPDYRGGALGDSPAKVWPPEG